MRAAFVVCGLLSLSGVLQAQTQKDDWEKMFHKASPTPAAATSIPDQPVSSAAVGGEVLYKDGGRSRTWIATAAQLGALKPWDPEQAAPPVSVPALVIRAKQYALTTFPPENWRIEYLELYPIKNTENKKWAFQFTFIRPATGAERQAAALEGTVGQGNSSQDNIRHVILLHDGTVVEPSLTQK